MSDAVYIYINSSIIHELIYSIDIKEWEKRKFATAYETGRKPYLKTDQ